MKTFQPNLDWQKKRNAEIMRKRALIADGQMCPGCEKDIDKNDSDARKAYGNEIWHASCLKEEQRYWACVDAEDKRRHEFDE